MITVDVVKDCVSNYKVSNMGRVINKNTNEEILDETLKSIIMTSFAVYSKAKMLHDLAKSQNNGKLNLPNGVDPKTHFIDKAIQRYGINGITKTFKENKLFQKLIDGDSEQKDNSFSDTLEGTEYEIFSGDNKKYGLAMLQYIARSKGKDFQSVQVEIDVTQQKKTGLSQITTKTIAKPFKPNQESLSSVQLDSMDDSLKIAYLETKANEYKIIGNDTMVNYYQANIERLKEKAKQSSIPSESREEKPKYSEKKQILLDEIEQQLGINVDVLLEPREETMDSDEKTQQTIINLLQSKNNPQAILDLSKLTGVPKEEIERQIDLYQTLEKYELDFSKSGLDASMQTNQKWEIINTLKKYAGMDSLPPEVLQDMNQKTIIDLLQSKKTPEVVLHLSEITGLSPEEAQSQMEIYKTMEHYELELMKSGLDASMQTNQKWEIINNLTQTTMSANHQQTR